MRITFNIPEFTRNERNSHCDVIHITPVRVARLVLDDAATRSQRSRRRDKGLWSGMMQILHHEQYPGESYIMFLPMIGLDPSYSSWIYTRMQFVSYQAKQYDATHIWPTLVLESPNKYPVSNSWLRSETFGSQTQMVSHVKWASLEALDI